MGIPDNIKKYRKKNKLTQNQLAQLIDKKEITVRRYEKGDITPPITVLLDIAIALGEPLEKIVEDDKNVVYEKYNNGYEVSLKEFSEVKETTNPQTILLKNYNKLNELGKTKLIEYSNDLINISKYNNSELTEENSTHDDNLMNNNNS